MGDRSGIQWTDATWNPLRGCSRVSEGCRNCYAERVAARFGWDEDADSTSAQRRVPGPYQGLTSDGRWNGVVTLVEEHLADPLRWKRPRRVFVNSMSDLFHERVPDEWIDRIFAVMALSPRHTFQVLTKRPERMRAYLTVGTGRYSAVLSAAEWVRENFPDTNRIGISNPCAIPLRNVWMGVSVEDQATADARIPLLLQTPAAVRFVSYEPALGPVDFANWLPHDDCDAADCDVDRCVSFRVGPDGCLDWIIVGGESGSGARPFDVEWARTTIAQCKAAGVACFVKQLGAAPYCGACATSEDMKRCASCGTGWTNADRKGGDPAEWSPDLRVREFPAVRHG